MSFSYDIGNPVGQVRFLLGDTNGAAPLFSDEEITGMLTLLQGSIYQVAAACCERLARGFASANNQVKIGDFGYQSESSAQHYLDLAERFREVEENIPAFAVAEENLSGFNELAIIRNWVLRTEGF